MSGGRLALAAVTVWLFLASGADAAEGWYASVQAGGNFLSDADLDEPTGVLVALGTNVEFDPGFNLAGALGYRWKKFRVEGEVAYAVNDIDQFEILGIGVNGGGDVDSVAFMANAFRDFDIGAPWSVYLGGGIGVAIISINDADILGVPLADDDDTAFAYQLGTGVGYEITRATTLSLDYRYFATTDPEFTDPTGIPFESEHDSHVIRVGLRFQF